MNCLPLWCGWDLFMLCLHALSPCSAHYAESITLVQDVLFEETEVKEVEESYCVKQNIQ